MVLLLAKRTDALFRVRHTAEPAAYGGGMTDAPGAGRATRVNRRRLVAALMLLLTVAAGLAVHTLAPDGAVSDIAGDALYAIAAYLAVVIVLPRLTTPLVAVVAAAWCTFVELFQLTGVPLALGSAFSPIMLVLGTVFDVRDLLIYLAGIATAALVDGLSRRGSAG